MQTDLTTIPLAALAPQALERLDRNPAAVYLASLSPGARRTMAQALATIAQIVSSGRQDVFTLAWHRLEYQHTSAVRSALAERFAPATANKCLAALRRTLKEAWRLGLMSAEQYQRAADLKTIKATVGLKGRALGEAEVYALLKACAQDHSPAGRRDSAIVAVLVGTGLRRAELAALTLGNLGLEGSLEVKAGKGRKDRTVYVQAGVTQAILGWLDLRGLEPGPLFNPINKAGKIEPRALTPQAVLNLLAKRARSAGVRAFSPHDLRRTFISNLLEQSGDTSAAQQLAGHSNVQTTMRYDRRGEVAKRTAAGKLHIPYIEPES